MTSPQMSFKFPLQVATQSTFPVFLCWIQPVQIHAMIFMTMHDDIRERFTLWLNFMLLRLYKLWSVRNGMKYKTVYDPMWSCVWLCMELQHKVSHRKFCLLCCVCVCLCKCEWTAFLLSCNAKNAPMGIDNLKKVVSCELFIQQFIRKMSLFWVESTSLGWG